MEQMLTDIKESIKESLPKCRINMEEQAEYYAEVYVSSKLGLEDDNEQKQIIKNQYIELFLHELSTNIFHIQ